MNINQIIFGDCLDLMSDIPDKCIDLVLCDLPYGSTARNGWDVQLPLEPLWKQYKRIIKPHGIVILTATQPFASHLICSNLAMFRYDMIWVKNKKTGFLNAKKMPLRQHEHVLVFYQKSPKYHPQKTTGHSPVHHFTKNTGDGTNYGTTKSGIKGGGQTDRYPTSVLNFPVVNNDSPDRTHPTQKPVALFKYLIQTYTDHSDLVLDNCIGSGTTAVACIECKRNFIGMENDPKFYDLACKRILDQ